MPPFAEIPCVRDSRPVGVATSRAVKLNRKRRASGAGLDRKAARPQRSSKRASAATRLIVATARVQFDLRE
ncbi:MAG: hypothetical protein QOF01_311 [Thermomicrobiales bacterium]|jgi:hypothetical protein|nr:hypothetical protein [Thermomicrobiales bacterium]